MNRSELVDHCKRIIEEAYQEATEMIVAYLEKHPNEPRQPLCREIDPDNWKALESRVMRLQEKRRSGSDSDVAIGRKPSWQVGDARRAFSNPEISPEDKASLVSEAMKDAQVREQVERRIASDDTATRRINQQAAQLHSSPDRSEPEPKPKPDYDQRYQDAVAEIVYREADRKAGRWNPNDRTLAARHFLLRALNDPDSVDAEHLIDEITRYLEEVS